MTVLYVREPGAMVRRDGERIRVTHKERATRRQKVLSALPVLEVEQVVVFGNVQVTTQAAALLLQHNVDIIFLSGGGAYRGRLQKDGSRFARLRHRQLQQAGDSKQARQLAIAIVRSKLTNQRNLLLALAEQVSDVRLAESFQTAAKGIGRMARDAGRSGSLDAVRGYEGKGGALYFGAIQQLLEPAWAFQGRRYYPPPDPFNALLSFGYALLQKDMETVAQRVGLDPYIGCLHALEYGRPSLVLDLMEEFRPLVVDRAMLDLVLGKKIKPDEFTFTGRPERPVELGPRLIPRVLKAYEERTADVVLHGPSRSQQRLRRCFELQTRIYARTIMGERRQYEGVMA